MYGSQSLNIVIGKLQYNVYKVRSIDNYNETKVLHRKEILDTKESFQDDGSLSNQSGSDTEENILW